ncbi:MAG: glycosyltransferase [Bdellovibrionota bacterium]
MAKVSIITALYNHERYIAQAIESVIAQTFSDWEHLIWDDGSTDKSLSIAQEYARRYPEKIKVFSHPSQANRGQENTRNCALEKASGELLCLLDSDDMYLPRKLELLVPCFQDPEVGLAYGVVEHYIESTGKVVPSGISKFHQGKAFEPLLAENFLGASATLFRRECVAKGLRFDPSFKTIGEYPLWLKIARDWKVSFVAEPVSRWRCHTNNLGKKLELQAKQELVTFFERLGKDTAYKAFSKDVARALAKRRYDYAAELHSILDLEESRIQCAAALTAFEASPSVRGKAALLFLVSLLGKKANLFVARLKRGLWHALHPVLASSKSTKLK